MRLGFIGAGKLAGSVIRGLLLKNVCRPNDIIASEPNQQLREQLTRELGIQVTTDNADAAQKSDIIFVGVKPAVVVPAIRDLGDAVADKLIVSFAAGIRIANIEAVTPARIMRVMTNTPSAIGRAATAFAAGTRATSQDRHTIRDTFSAVGEVVEVDDAQIDAVTALAGSGPAFVYKIIEALASGGVREGLPRDAALRLAAQMTLGAAELALTSGKSPDELIAQVVTPGGTTAAGLAEMEARNALEAISAAVSAAASRGREMSTLG